MGYLYILKSLGQPFQMYVGVTGDVDRRIADHNSGRCSHTAKFMPWEEATGEGSHLLGDLPKVEWYGEDGEESG